MRSLLYGEYSAQGMRAAWRASTADPGSTRVVMTTFELPSYFDYLAAFVWAISGGLVAARKGFDFVGITVLALVTATGGGLLRDGLFLQNGPPVLVRGPNFLLITLAAALIVWMFGRRIHAMRPFDGLVSLVDGFGMGAYAVVGTELARQNGIDTIGAAVVGVVTAVGGGVLRDVLASREPDLFKPGALVATTALAGCVAFVVLTRVFAMPPAAAGWVTVAIVFLLQQASMRLGIRTTPAPGFDKHGGPP